MNKYIYMKKRARNEQGFTLLEILLVVAAIAILAGIVIVAINPAKQLGDTRNAQRRADVNTILNASYQYLIDNGGVLPPSITPTSTEICATGAGSCVGLIDLTVLTTGEKYIFAIPIEPLKTNPNGVGYMINRTTGGRIRVDAQFEEQGASISVTR